MKSHFALTGFLEFSTSLYKFRRFCSALLLQPLGVDEVSNVDVVGMGDLCMVEVVGAVDLCVINMLGMVALVEMVDATSSFCESFIPKISFRVGPSSTKINRFGISLVEHKYG